MERSLSTSTSACSSAQGDPLAALPARIAAGDESALQELYEATSARVFGLALRILRERATAEEAVIDVYAQVWRQAGRFDPAKGTLQVWIATLARTRAIDLARVQQRRQQRETPIGNDLAESLPAADLGPLAAATLDDRAQRLRAALETLPREQRQAVDLAFFGGLSHSEVARALAAPLGTIKTRIRTGLNHLRTALAAVEGEL